MWVWAAMADVGMGHWLSRGMGHWLPKGYGPLAAKGYGPLVAQGVWATMADVRTLERTILVTRGHIYIYTFGKCARITLKCPIFIGSV